jgi:hypothetical protein
MPKRFRGGILQARLPEINTSTNFVTDGIYNTADAAQYIGTGNWTGSLKYQQYGTPGTYSFIVPDGVNTISVLAVGAGGAGDDGNAGDGGGGGGAGGACAVASNVAVIPGNTITVVVGTGGASGQGKGVRAESGGNTTVTFGSFIMNAVGGQGGAPYTANPGANGANAVFSSIPAGVVTAGYIGGNGGGAFDGGGGGGGAAGAAGAGGTGSHSNNQTATEAPTNSYAGGGGGARSSAGIGSLGGATGGTGQTNITGGGGGGAYTFTSVAAFLDTNGSNGNGLTTSGSKGGNGGFPGGGGGGSFDGGVGVASSGGNGFVRIVWGTNSSGVRKFPDNALDT